MKRRIVVSCREVGLQVDSARMGLARKFGVRIIHVEASPSAWLGRRSPIEIIATVATSGEIVGNAIRLVCSAARDADHLPVLHVPYMVGRGQVPLHRLVDELSQTLREREQVLAALDAGQSPPFHFGQIRWDVPLQINRAH